MVELSIVVNRKQRTAYFKKTITNALGFNLCAQLSSITGIIYPKGADKNDVIHSLEIILADLKHQTQLEIRRKNNVGMTEKNSKYRQ